MIKSIIAATVGVLASSSAHGESYYGQALLAMDAISCSFAAQALDNSHEAEEFLELGTFVLYHIYSNLGDWQASAYSDMPGIFLDMSKDAKPPLSDKEISDMAYFTAQFVVNLDHHSDEREREKSVKAGMDAGQLFTLKRDLARERWQKIGCESIEDRYLR
ncbi:MAG: hypothetical protein KBF85_09160 [Tabrizicola sp.]|jgi:hypothetical protein|nr:hypothetical protein [Tabrizicola sp.]